MNELLEKYWKGETSLEDEQSLRHYFASSNVREEHEIYRPLFDHDEAMDTMELDAFAKIKTRRKPLNQWLSMAAGFALILGTVFAAKAYNRPDLGTYDSPEQAYHATLNALTLMSQKMNKGKQNLAPAIHVNKKTAPLVNIIKQNKNEK